MAFRQFLLAGLLAFSGACNAVPTLFFDGGFQFDADTGLLSIDAVVDGSVDLSAAGGASGSSLHLVTQLGSVLSTGPFIDAGFGTAGGDDFTLASDSAVLLLGASVNHLTMSGVDGFSYGVLDGQLDATSGLLLADFFTDASLFALQLELSLPFGMDMFLSDFAGRVDGQITGVPGTVSVPEPASVVLVVIGALGLVWSRHRLNRHQN